VTKWNRPDAPGVRSDTKLLSNVVHKEGEEDGEGRQVISPASPASPLSSPSPLSPLSPSSGRDLLSCERNSV